MKKIALLTVLLAGIASAAPTQNGGTVNVHIYATHWFVSPSPAGMYSTEVEKLDAVISGKKYELEADAKGVWLMPLGDYKAKRVKNARNPAGETSQTYEFLLPNGQTRKFIVVGESE